MGLNSIFNGYTVAASAHGIPLDTYPAEASRTIVSLFAVLGLSNLLICAVCVFAMIRQRSLVPMMFALLLMQQLGIRVIAYVFPPASAGTTPSVYINLLLLVLTLAGLAQSLRRSPSS